MLYHFLQNCLIFFLLFTINFALFRLFLYDNYLKKISSLCVVYSSLLLLLILFFRENAQNKELFLSITYILIIFSLILASGIAIMANISELEN